MSDVKFHAGANEDYLAAFLWYGEKNEVLAQSFAEEVDRALSRIADSPNRYPKIDEIHRCVLLQRFPYQLIYRDELDEVIVVAIAHAKRRPGYWLDREG